MDDYIDPGPFDQHDCFRSKGHMPQAEVLQLASPNQHLQQECIFRTGGNSPTKQNKPTLSYCDTQFPLL